MDGTAEAKINLQAVAALPFRERHSGAVAIMETECALSAHEFGECTAESPSECPSLFHESAARQTSRQCVACR